MKVNETVKALRNCVNEPACTSCDFNPMDFSKENISECKDNLMLAAADQLEQLNDFKQSQCAKLLIKVAEKNEVIQELQTENEQLKKSRLISCGECKYYNYLVPQRCALCNFEVLLPDDFCSYGERRGAE